MATQLKIIQHKSTIGAKPNQRETVRTLGLKRIGHVVIKEDRPEIRGMVRTVRHLVTVEEVGTVESPASAASATISPQVGPASAGGDEMSDLAGQLASEGDGVRVFGEGEFVEWHKSELGRSVIWSSDLALQDLLRVVETTIGSTDDEHRGLVDFDDEPSGPTTARAARKLALGNPHRVTFLRLEFDSGIALIWTPKPGSDELAQLSNYAETAVFFTSATTTIEAAARTMGQTATRRLVALAGKIVASVAA